MKVLRSVNIGSALLALVVLSWPALNVNATPVAYNLDVALSTCTSYATGQACAGTDAVSAGHIYRGHFTIDDSVLATDGYTNAGFESFHLTLGSYVWDSLLPPNASDYRGSRYYDPQANVGGFGPWTLHVQNGQLNGICCGVYGAWDVPFVDLYSWSVPGGNFPQNFFAVNAASFGEFSFRGQGSFSIHAIPEPSLSLSVLALLLGAALTMLLRQRRRTSQTSHTS